MSSLLGCRAGVRLLVLGGLLLAGTACLPWAASAPPGARPQTAQAPPSGATALPPGGTVPVPPDLNSVAQVFTMLGGLDDPPTLDPALAADEESLGVIRQIFSGLVRLDDTLAVVPDLAAALPDVSPDGRTYTFHLRRNVQWPDGHALTAADVQYALERATDPALAAPQPGTSLPAGLYLSDILGVPARLAGAPGPLPGVRVAATDTIALTLAVPRAYFLQKLTTFYVVNRANVEAGGATWYRQPQGTGPFRLKTWRSGDRITLEPNPTYYAGPPHLALVNLLLGAAATGGLVQYEQGTVDAVGVAPNDVDRVQDPADPLHPALHVVPVLATTYLGFSVQQPPFDDPKVREAVSLVLDRTKVARVMFNGRVLAAGGLVPPGLPGYAGPVAVPAPDVARARRLLAESRYGGPAGLAHIALYTTGGDLGVMIQEVVKQQLGVDMELHSEPWADYLAGLNRHAFPAFVLTWRADWPDPSSFLESLLRSGSPDNHSGLADPAVDTALDSAADAPNPGRRAFLYAEAEQAALAETPVVPLFYGVSYMLLRPTTHNVVITPLGILNLRDAWISGAQP